MAGGSVTIQVDQYNQLQQVAQRVLCWALTDAPKVRMDTSGPVPRIVIPEAVLAGKGALALRRGGADVVAGYVAGTNIVHAVSNLVPAVGQAYPACGSSAAQPNGTVAITTPPWGITLTVDNLAAGTVRVDWGDGTVTTGVAQNGTPTKTYAPFPGPRTITITDETDATQFATISFNLPYNV